MTTIIWQGDGSVLTRSGGTETSSVNGLSARVGAVSSDARSAFSGSTQARLTHSLTSSLTGALRRLDERIDAVSWPSGALSAGLVPFGARTVSIPAALEDSLSATLNPQGQSSAEDRLATRAKNARADSGLAGGVYAMTLSLGGAADPLSVTIGEGWTTGQVFSAVAEAVNASSLAVGAEVRTNASGLLNGRTSLVLSTDASDAGQAVSLANDSGRLASWLGLEQAATASGSASIGTTSVTALATAKPTRYASGGFDPEAQTTLAPGTYTLDYLVGPTTVGQPASGEGEQGSVSIQVSSGDTWREVLSRMARVLGSSSAAMVSRLVPAKRVWSSATDEEREVVDAIGLEVLSNTAKSGWKLSLSGADAASQSLLDTLGLNATAQPGSTARAVIDGRQRTSATGAFSADSGRMTLMVSGTFGEAAPVRVSQPVAQLSDALADVLAAYNEVTDLLDRNAPEIKAGVMQEWTDLASDRAAGLGAIGVEQTGSRLWLSEEAFLSALFSRPEAVESALLDADGLLPAIQEQTEAALSGGVEDWLSAGGSAPASATDPLVRAFAVRTELEVEKSSQLLDLYDADNALGTGILDAASGSALLRRRG